jgi:hypothetical protein
MKLKIQIYLLAKYIHNKDKLWKLLRIFYNLKVKFKLLIENKIINMTKVTSKCKNKFKIIKNIKIRKF